MHVMIIIMYGEKMTLNDDKRCLIIKGKEGKDYQRSIDY